MARKVGVAVCLSCHPRFSGAIRNSLVVLRALCCRQHRPLAHYHPNQKHTLPPLFSRIIYFRVMFVHIHQRARCCLVHWRIWHAVWIEGSILDDIITCEIYMIYILCIYIYKEHVGTVSMNNILVFFLFFHIILWSDQSQCCWVVRTSCRVPWRVISTAFTLCLQANLLYPPIHSLSLPTWEK